MAKERVEIKDQVNVSDFEAVKISVASPKDILDWSHGEVIKPETINYRTQKPERDGLFCEKIFGPIKDWECYCGKYKKVRYKGVVCDKCGVEVTRSSVRRVRMGHIDLAVPVTHIWYTKSTSSVIASVLGMTVSNLEKVVYFASFIIMNVDENIKNESLELIEKEYKDYLAELKKDTDSSDASKEIKKQKIDAAYKEAKSELNGLKNSEIITEQKYFDLVMKYGQVIKVGIGAEAILECLKKADLDEAIEETNKKLEGEEGPNKRKLLKRLRILYSLKNADIDPEWLILTRIPVIPPDLRPMVQLDGGRFAASDLNDLYRRVLNRNNRLKRLITQGAPEVICRNEKRMLQEAVDALIDNSARRGKVASSAGGKRKLRSLSDMIRGKQGRFRQNLLGKRVDYSGRSVIVVGPNLKLHQCGIPKKMALELFKPFVIGRLIKDGYVHNVKNATRLIEKGEEFVWDILEEITQDRHVMLNRAPTLHRLGIQAFQPVLIEGKAIQVHPLVCAAFNADFDGDQMAVHVPLSKNAEKEAREILLSSKNLLKPASGQPIVTPELDMTLGMFYLTMQVAGEKGEGKAYGSYDAAISAYDRGGVELHAPIKLKVKGGEIIETTIGRAIINEAFPADYEYQNEDFNKKKIQKSIAEVYKLFGKEETAILVDALKDLGFKYAEKSGISFSSSDISVPAKKGEIIKEANGKLDVINKQYAKGLLTDEERYAKTVELWMEVSGIVEKEMIETFDKKNDIYTIFSSGARGNISQLNQIAGMKGLVADPTGNIIELPIISNFKEGLSVFEYFESTHGSRKGRADTALRTSEAGYLTRRLVDVSQDTVIVEDDCGGKEARVLEREHYVKLDKDWKDHMFGRVLAEDVAGVKKGTMLTSADTKKIDESNAKEIRIYSLLTCVSEVGACKRCYGADPATGKLVETGATVGIVAAQAIGEPGTQLTMRTFHTGGAAGEDITSGLPRVEELFEARNPKSPASVSELNGTVTISRERNDVTVQVAGTASKDEATVLPKGYKWVVVNGDMVKRNQTIAESGDNKPVRAKMAGSIKIKKDSAIVSGVGKTVRNYTTTKIVPLKVADGDKVKKGDMLTEGHYNLNQSLKLRGISKTYQYVIDEVQKIYDSQGQDINDKHLEVIVKQMSSRVKIISSDDPIDYLPGKLAAYKQVLRENRKREKSGKKKIEFERIILGMSRVALRTDSFLSAASFMETTSVLINAAISGDTDSLKGLKENIIIGKLIPAGTGYRK